MANAFSKFRGKVDKPNRNVFDLSFQNNLTFNIGGLYPVLCKEVIPGDSYRIKPTFGLRFMPTAFPLQTRLNANLHFFYVRNRNLWKDWMDFIGNNKADLVPPYLSPTAGNHDKTFKTGSLADYLGVPTTLAGSYGTQRGYGFQGWNNGGTLVPYYFDATHVSDIATVGSAVGHVVTEFMAGSTNTGTNTWYGTWMSGSGRSSRIHNEIGSDGFVLKMSKLPSPVPAGGSPIRVMCIDKNGVVAADVNGTFSELSSEDFTFTVIMDATNLSAFNSAAANLLEDGYYIGVATQKSVGFFNQLSGTLSVRPVECLVTASEDYTVDAVDTVAGVPWASVRNLGNQFVRLSALPFRAYEAIYNAFYRNQQNDPFQIDGVAEYNKYIPTNEGGGDTFDYQLHYRNWEMDYLTSALQSPQQGIAPLVGVNAAGTFTFEDSTGKQYTAKAVVGDDGETLTGISTASADIPQGSLRMLVDAISHGISINDFRNVNALQRWLETNIRRGYKYKDQLLSHFGVDATFEELDMPEFIGGMSRQVNVSQINQSVSTDDDPLGSYAGQLSCFGDSEHEITKYCDEHGFIIGILSVTPVPNYSQLLPKMFLKSNHLDYFFPEFGHIGLQPIDYREVCPIQAWSADFNAGQEVTSIHDVFGYQRAWYDYLASTDEVHGEFRTSLRDFLMNRVFSEKPELGHDFLAIKPESVNNVFTVTDTSDKILGIVYFDITSKRPIPKFGIPRLE